MSVNTLFDKDNKLSSYPFANEYAEVGMNPETKQPEIKRYSSDYESDDEVSVTKRNNRFSMTTKNCI